MPDHTVVNLGDEVPNRAPEFGVEGLEGRFARIPLALKESGLSEDGAVILAFGAPSNENKDAVQVPGWWDG